jgi:hypothetical protein
MEFRSEFWCSRNCSSTMRAFPRSALRVIWYFYHTADRHPSMIKSVGDFISTQRNSLRTPCVILEGCAHIFFCKLLRLSDGSRHVGYMIKHFALKPHCIRSSHFKVMTSVHLKLVQSRQYALLKTTYSVTALVTYAMTLVMAWMPRRRNMDLLVLVDTSTRLDHVDWIQCGFKIIGKLQRLFSKF